MAILSTYCKKDAYSCDNLNKERKELLFKIKKRRKVEEITKK